jgi:hypothetical protein
MISYRSPIFYVSVSRKSRSPEQIEENGETCNRIQNLLESDYLEDRAEDAS